MIKAINLVESAGTVVEEMFCPIHRKKETEKTFSNRCSVFSILRVSGLL